MALNPNAHLESWCWHTASSCSVTSLWRCILCEYRRAEQNWTGPEPEVACDLYWFWENSSYRVCECEQKEIQWSILLVWLELSFMHQLREVGKCGVLRHDFFLHTAARSWERHSRYWSSRYLSLCRLSYLAGWLDAIWVEHNLFLNLDFLKKYLH